MSRRSIPRSRRETRAIILENLLKSHGAFRQSLSREVGLAEASISRILAEFRDEGIITEERVTSGQAGRPTIFVTLSKSIRVMGVELSNDRLSFGVGDIAGTLDYVERLPVSRDLDQTEFEHLFRNGLAVMRRWIGSRDIVVRQAAISIPGYNGGGFNPIFPWDMKRLERFVTEELESIPVVLTNSVIAQAAFHRYSNTESVVNEDHLFLFVGHGVAGAIIKANKPIDAFSPVELGHMVLEKGGLTCRCGHRGCLEAYTSLPAITEIAGISEDEALKQGDRFIELLGSGPEMRARLRERLALLGIGIGNTLNLHPISSVVISGWPSLMLPEDRAAIRQGIDESLLGGVAGNRPSLRFIAPAIGTDPQAALLFSCYCLMRRGATPFHRGTGANSVVSQSAAIGAA